MSTTAHLKKAAAKYQDLNPLGHGLLLQCKCACGSPTSSLTGECEECKSKKGLQAKLTIGASNDPLEQEAERVAEQVMATPANAAITATRPQIQRFTGQAAGQTATAPATVDRALASPGRPLDPALRQDMEQRFGHDFSWVRVHTGGTAEQSTREVNANAYTVGRNIVFGSGQFSPSTHEGRRLIAHELMHVVQQSNEYIHPMIQRQEKNNADLAAIQGLPMYELLTQLSKFPENVLANETEAWVVGGPRLIIAMRTARAKKQNDPDFLINNRSGIQALPADQAVDILKFLSAPKSDHNAPMGGTYEDYKKDPDYIDNFSSAGYDPSSNTLHLFFDNGGEAILTLPLQSTGGITFLAFERKSLLYNPKPQDLKIYPSVHNKNTLPIVAQWLADHSSEMEQSNLLLQAGMGALTARSLPDNLWWLALLAPTGGIGARFAAGRMRPAFKTIQPESNEIPIIKASAKGGKSPVPITNEALPKSNTLDSPNVAIQGEQPVYRHGLNRGGLDDIMSNQRMISTKQGNAGIGGEAVRAYTGPWKIDKWKGGSDLIEFTTNLTPNTHGPSMGGDTVTWSIPEGQYLKIRLLRVYHRDGSITVYDSAGATTKIPPSH